MKSSIREKITAYLVEWLIRFDFLLGRNEKGRKQVFHPPVQWPSHLTISGWEVGCRFVEVPPQSPDSWIDIAWKTVEEKPNDGTSSSRVSGIWYGNAEIKGYLREGSWRPWAGKFRLVFSVGGLPPGWRPETQELVGWWRKPFVNSSIWTIEDYGF